MARRYKRYTVIVTGDLRSSHHTAMEALAAGNAIADSRERTCFVEVFDTQTGQRLLDRTCKHAPPPPTDAEYAAAILAYAKARSQQ